MSDSDATAMRKPSLAPAKGGKGRSHMSSAPPEATPEGKAIKTAVGLVGRDFDNSPRSKSILEKALKSRFVEEALLDLFSKGKLHGTVHTCIGQEVSGAVISEFLRDGDTIFSNHRCHGHFVSRTDDIEGLIAELMGRKTGVSGGLGGSQHLYKDGFYSNGIQGGIVPVAAGLALGHKLRKTNNVSVVFIGDGTLGEGVIYEAFNIASKWNLPLLVVLEDNKFSQSTSQEETLAGDIKGRAAAFGIEAKSVNTWDWSSFADVAGEMIEGMRLDQRPRFLHVETYRLKAHSKGDDTRPREMVEPFELVDPLNVFLQRQSSEEAEWIGSILARVNAAIEVADAAPLAALPDEPASSAKALNWSAVETGQPRRMVAGLSEAFAGLMEEFPDIQMLGEDILSPYGGAFKATSGLSTTFPERVRNTPISEAGIVGIGAGLGLAGFYPIVEIMFGDFVGLAFDQLVNHAAKFNQMYNNQVSSNLIVRTPMGGGRGYGPTHSQTFDKHFFGVPGLRVVALNSVAKPDQIYRPLLHADSGPTLVIENKLMYGAYVNSGAPAGFQYLSSDETFPTIWMRPDTDLVDITLIGYGGIMDLLVAASEELFDAHDIVAQVVSPTQLYPYDVASISDIVGSAKQALIVEEGQGFAGFAAELMAQLSESSRAPRTVVRRLSPRAFCIPSSGPLEKEMLPSVAGIVAEVLKMAKS